MREWWDGETVEGGTVGWWQGGTMGQWEGGTIGQREGGTMSKAVKFVQCSVSNFFHYIDGLFCSEIAHSQMFSSMTRWHETDSQT